jgi:hypothetical protein
MSVIANSTLIVRRVTEAHRRRDMLRDRRENVARVLPDWTLLPLRLAGMSAAEIQSAMEDQMQAEHQAGIEKIDREIEQVDHEIDRMESQLLVAPPVGLDGVGAILRLALDRLREKTVTDETSIFFDYGDARLLALLERAAADLDDVVGSMQLRAG